MDLRQLKYFIAVAEERNFGKAAARLHISQPPISRLVRLLEEELGVLLFERRPWGVQLTAAGEALLPGAREIAAMVSFASDQTRRVGAGEAGRLNIGVFGSGAISIVPAILRRYSKKHPQVEVSLLNVPQAAQIQALRQHRILITFDRYLPDEPDLTVEVIAKERLVLAVHESNHLAKRRYVNFSALKNEPLLMARDPLHADWLRALCFENGFEPRVSQRAGDVVSALIMVANGFGVEIAPESVQALRLPGLCYRPLRGAVGLHTHLDLHCAYRKGEISPLLKGILEAARAYDREASK